MCLPRGINISIAKSYKPSQTPQNNYPSRCVLIQFQYQRKNNFHFIWLFKICCLYLQQKYPMGAYEPTYLVIMEVDTEEKFVILRKTEEEIREMAKSLNKYDYCVINGSIIKSFNSELPTPWFHMMQHN
jgi:hypothetical protein